MPELLLAIIRNVSGGMVKETRLWPERPASDAAAFIIWRSSDEMTTSRVPSLSYIGDDTCCIRGNEYEDHRGARNVYYGLQ